MSKDSATSRSITLYLSLETIARLEALASSDKRSLSNVAELVLDIGLPDLESEEAMNTGEGKPRPAA